MKDRVEVNPGDISKAVLLSGQNLEDEMVSVEEPLMAENVENLED